MEVGRGWGGANMLCSGNRVPGMQDEKVPEICCMASYTLLAVLDCTLKNFQEDSVHVVWFSSHEQKQCWEWKSTLRIWEFEKDKQGNLGILYIWAGQVQDWEVEGEEEHLGYTQESHSCAGACHHWRQSWAQCFVYHILLDCRIAQWLKARSLVSRRSEFEPWLCWLWIDNFLSSPELMFVQKRIPSTSREKIKWGNLHGNLSEKGDGSHLLTWTQYQHVWLTGWPSYGSCLKSQPRTFCKADSLESQHPCRFSYIDLQEQISKNNPQMQTFHKVPRPTSHTQAHAQWRKVICHIEMRKTEF